VITLTEFTADHYVALSNIIAALAPGHLGKALDYTRVVNTEVRRDDVLLDILRALLKRPIQEINVREFQEVLTAIANADSLDKGYSLIMERFVEERPSTSQLRELLPVISQLPTIRESVKSCRALVCALKILKASPVSHESLESHLVSMLHSRWSGIDIGWSRIDCGFRVASDLVGVRPDEANKILTETEQLKSEWSIANQRPAAVYVACIRLTIRAWV
jgi:hypothetical protein